MAKLNTLVATIPWMFFTGMAGVSRREFYEAPEGQDAAPRVDFGTGTPPDGRDDVHPGARRTPGRGGAAGRTRRAPSGLPRSDPPDDPPATTGSAPQPPQ